MLSNNGLLEGIDGVNNTVIIKQANDRGYSGDQNIIEIRRVWGDRNTLKLVQGYQIGTNGNFNRDYAEYWYTFTHINNTGDDNNVLMTQRTNGNSSGHEYWLHLEGDDNDIYTVQREGGSQYINLDIYTDGNDVDLIQKWMVTLYVCYIKRNRATDVDITQASHQNKSYIAKLLLYCRWL